MSCIKYLLLILVIGSTACKGIKRMGEVREAVQTSTDHKSVSISYRTSTSDGKQLNIVLYNYPMETRDYKALEEKAKDIDQAILKAAPEWKDLDGRVIAFTASSDPEELSNAVSFKFPQ